MMDMLLIFGAVAVVAASTGYVLGRADGQRAEALAIADLVRGAEDVPEELEAVDAIWRPR